jgi:hypothetical protein
MYVPNMDVGMPPLWSPSKWNPWADPSATNTRRETQPRSTSLAALHAMRGADMALR